MSKLANETNNFNLTLLLPNSTIDTNKSSKVNMTEIIFQQFKYLALKLNATRSLLDPLTTSEKLEVYALGK